MEKILFVFIGLLGLIFIIKHKTLGRFSIEQRKKWNKILPFPQSEKNLDENTIHTQQTAYLIVGIIFFLLGLVSLFQ